MPVEINDRDIEMAERILFGKTGAFTCLEGESEEIIHSKRERCDFIKDLRTLDLQAVPGSGKTTALLAKLIILESKLPFEDGSGILVLSHTNAAIEEIKRKIEHHCPKLFHYPNFVGTIQSFVDQFLAISYYANKNCKRPYRIDNEIHSEYVTSFYYKTKNYKLKGWLDHNFPDNPIVFLENLRFDSNCFLVSKIDGTVESFKLRNQNTPTYISLKNFKIQQIKDGILHFDDVYFLSSRYLNSYPEITNLLESRFKFVFVDEMQDMDKHQVDLLESLFFNEEKSKTIYQRIGDKNQAIHNDIESDDCWNDRKIILKFTGSHRLNPFTANVVKPFGLNTIEINGLAKSEIEFVKPHLIVYDEPEEVLPKYAELIKAKNLDKVKTNDKYPFRAVGWVAPFRRFSDGEQKGEPDYSKHVIKSFFNKFEKESEKIKQDYSCLDDYLIHYDQRDNTLGAIQKNIMNAFIKSLRKAEIHNEDSGGFYTATSFLKFFREKEGNEKEYQKFKGKLFEWSLSIIKGIDKHQEIGDYLSNLITNHFHKTTNENLTVFLTDKSERGITPFNECNNENIFSNESNGIKVKIGTIHSVKGETHVATLVFDTFHENFNSLILSNPFRGEPHGINIKKADKDKIKKRTAKMLYVAFSRPTHLLCFAIHKDRFREVFENHISANETEKLWTII